MSEEDRENEYPEGSLGWKINRKLDAIYEKPLKSGAVFMLLFVAFFTPALVEILLYPHSPFFIWCLGLGAYNVAQWNMVVYIVVWLIFAVSFFYYGARLLCRGVRARPTSYH
jgi:hypothetical protein